VKQLWRDTDPDTEAELVKRLRDATPARRFEIADALSRTVIRLSRLALVRQKPEAREIEVLLEWVGLHYGEDIERELRAHLGEGARAS
jgi:hypothetical protein